MGLVPCHFMGPDPERPEFFFSCEAPRFKPQGPDFFSGTSPLTFGSKTLVVQGFSRFRSHVENWILVATLKLSMDKMEFSKQRWVAKSPILKLEF